MGKIYDPSLVRTKIDSILVEQTEAARNGPTYGKSLFSPEYQRATLIGITLSIF